MSVALGQADWIMNIIALKRLSSVWLRILIDHLKIDWQVFFFVFWRWGRRQCSPWAPSLTPPVRGRSTPTPSTWTSPCTSSTLSWCATGRFFKDVFDSWLLLNFYKERVRNCSRTVSWVCFKDFGWILFRIETTMQEFFFAIGGRKSPGEAWAGGGPPVCRQQLHLQLYQPLPGPPGGGG